MINTFRGSSYVNPIRSVIFTEKIGRNLPMDLRTWCRNQVEEIKRHKWIEGVKQGKDPGEKAVIEWVQRYAKDYRQEYQECFDAILVKVEAEVKSKLTGKITTIDEKELHLIATTIIEQFTKEWIKEAALNIKHIEEI
jgi:hypothetical protein